jgi:dynein heavy chain 2
MGRSLYDCFLLRVGLNLRIFITLDPENSKYQQYIRSNPALLNKCDIFWTGNFSDTSYKYFAQEELETFLQTNFNETAQDGRGCDVNAICDNLVEIHRSAGKAPREFFSLLSNYLYCTNDKLKLLNEQSSH